MILREFEWIWFRPGGDSPALRWRVTGPPNAPQAPLTCLDSWHHEIGFNSLCLLPVPKFVLKSASIGNNPVESPQARNENQCCSMVLDGARWFSLVLDGLQARSTQNTSKAPGLGRSRDQVSHECYQYKCFQWSLSGLVMF